MIPANPSPFFLNKPFPFVKAEQSGQKGTVTASTTVSIPSARVAGDMLVIAIAGGSDTSQTVTTPSGWTRITNANPGFLVFFQVYWKISDGTETSVTFNATKNHLSAWNCFVISGASNIASATPATSTSGQPDCPSLSPSWGSDSTLWLAIAGQFSTTQTQSVLSGYTNFGQAFNTFGGLDYPRIMWCRREDASQTLDPPAYPNSIVGGGVRWASTTIAIRG